MRAAVVAATALLAVVPPARADGPHRVFRFQDPRIVESSALVDLGHGLMATVNDSGDGPRVFVVDRHGRTVGVTDYGGPAVDEESMAPVDAGHVWVGDTGGNTVRRRSVQVHRVPVGRGDRSVRAPGYELRYLDGPHDAETLLADPRTGRLLVVTKALLGGGVYAAPGHLRADRPNPLRLVGHVPGLLTDGTFLPDGRHLLLRGYTSARVLAFPSLRPVGPAFPLPAQRQGEGISVGPGDRIRLSSEGSHAPVLQIRLPAAVQAALARPASSHPPPTAPSHPHRHADPAGHPSWWPPASGATLAVLGGAWLWALRRRR
jgi:hypothetical protein